MAQWASFKIDHPVLNQTYHFTEAPDLRPVAPPVNIPDSTLFSLIKSNFDKHEEDNNIDFYYEHNVPKCFP
jgi:hypothetical protein